MFEKYVQYIKNTRMVPLPVAFFDNDWDPIGRMVRADLEKAGLIRQTDGGILLTAKGEAL